MMHHRWLYLLLLSILSCHDATAFVGTTSTHHPAAAHPFLTCRRRRRRHRDANGSSSSNCHHPQPPQRRYQLRRTISHPSFMGLLSDDSGMMLPLTSSSSPQQLPPLSSALTTAMNHQQQQQHDIVIIGGGLAGLSAALYLRQLDPSRRVTILDRETTTTSSTTIASMAAAGMLAPQSERLPPGPLLDLCLASRRMYAEFCHVVERLAQTAATTEQQQHNNNNNNLDFWGPLHLHQHDNDSSAAASQLPPWSVGYVASGGFLAPAFAGDSVATWAPPPESAGSAVWLDAIQIREMEPHLHPNVVGGWWFPEDASVDARRLTCSLRAACHVAGVELCQGPDYEVTSLDLVDGSCRGIWCHNGQYLRPNKVLVANGSWMRQLLPVPIEPHKGQSLSLRMPSDRPPILRRVLFAQDSYLVPKADGRIIVGATVEAGSFDPHVTPAGLMHIMSYALQLVPGLADLPVEETWVGLRPTTPDKGPILGKTPWDNLYLAAGYWRNGVLLAPKTGQLVASMVLEQPLSPDDQALVDAFAWDRFTNARGGARLAAETRLAAAMHPIHSRRSGAGVAAAVGTELGSYSMARSASSERQQDRAALFGTGDGGDDLLERAAALGKQDAAAYDFGRPVEEGTIAVAGNVKSSEEVRNESPLSSSTTTRFEGTPDAFTVGSSNASHDEEETTTAPISSSSSTSSNRDLNTLYEQIKMNKPARNVIMQDPVDEDRPDPGFRIYQADPVTGELIEIPPYTSLESLNRGPQPTTSSSSSSSSSAQSSMSTNGDHDDAGGDGILDGYQAIQDAAASEADAKAAMRNARLNNRFGALGQALDIDLSSQQEQTPSPQSQHQQQQQKQHESAPNGAPPKDHLLEPELYEEDYDETTLDGYQTIHDAYPSSTTVDDDAKEQAEREALREIRRRNRSGQSDIDISQVGAQRTPGL